MRHPLPCILDPASFSVSAMPVCESLLALLNRLDRLSDPVCVLGKVSVPLYWVLSSSLTQSQGWRALSHALLPHASRPLLVGSVRLVPPSGIPPPSSAAVSRGASRAGPGK